MHILLIIDIIIWIIVIIQWVIIEKLNEDIEEGKINVSEPRLK